MSAVCTQAFPAERLASPAALSRIQLRLFKGNNKMQIYGKVEKKNNVKWTLKECD